MKDIINKKIKHLIANFGFKKAELEEIKKMYSGDFFNCEDAAYKRLVLISNQLCEEYSNITGLMGEHPSFRIRLKTFFRKRKIMGLLFPIHGFIASMGENIKVIIGLVDFHGSAFMNRGVEFLPTTLVSCGNDMVFAIRIKLGNDSVERKGNLIKLNKIVIKKGCWICAGVNIDGGVVIGERCVVGAGANVTCDIENDCLAVGRPCKVIAKIDKNYKSKSNQLFEFSQDDINTIKQHIKKLKFKGALKQYEKAIRGELFNSTNISLGRLFIYTHSLCSELNNEHTSEFRRSEIIDILFPIHGKNFSIGKNFYMDLIGTVIIGNNVNIKDNVCIAGDLIFEDNVIIENDVTIFASSHSVIFKERKVGFSLKKGLYEYTNLGFIKIKNGITIHKNAILVPNLIVEQDIPENSLVVNNKIIR